MGYKMTDEHKKKIAESVKRGLFQKCRHCGKQVWIARWQAKRKTPKAYCGRDCFKAYYKKNFAKSGKKNPAWKGGLKRLRVRALHRDRWTCRTCGFSEKKIMQVDHIVERRAGGKNVIENLQTLCPNCHARKTLGFAGK